MRKAIFAVLVIASALVPCTRACAADGSAAPSAPPSPRAAATATPGAPSPALRDDPNGWRVFGPTESTESAQLPASSGYGGDAMKVALSLAAVLAAVALCAWGFKRFAPRTASMFASENLKVVARTHLGPKQAVYLVRAPGSLLVVAATQERITLLSQVTDAAEIERALATAQSASPKSISNSFKTLLSGATENAHADKDADTARDLAAAVRSVSDRFAKLNRRIETIEQKTD